MPPTKVYCFAARRSATTLFVDVFNGGSRSERDLDFCRRHQTLESHAERVMQDAIDLKSAGLDIDPSELSEKTGYTLNEE